MGLDRRRVAFAALTLLGVLPLPVHAVTLTLVYRDGNRWVAPADNKPLRTLLKAAAAGHTHYSVVLPSANRELAADRVLVLQKLLTRDAKQPVLLEEIDGFTKADSLKISY